MTTAALPAVRDVFQELLENLEPEPEKVEADVERAKKIVKAVAEIYDVAKWAVMGSHRKETAVAVGSDVDIFVILRKKGVYWGGHAVSSQTVLSNCRDSIRVSLPTTPVSCDSVAVSVNIDRATHVIEVVPALFEEFTQFPRYRIPDGRGEWLTTAPIEHARWLADAHKKSGNRLKPIVRLLKAWALSRQNTTPLRAYYLECALGVENVVGGPWPHSEALYRAFWFLNRLGCGSLRDPLGVSKEPVRPTRTQSQTAAVRAHVKRALELAGVARTEEARGRSQQALERWSQVFNHEWF